MSTITVTTTAEDAASKALRVSVPVERVQEAEHKKRSLELLMRYVLPAINGDNANRVRSFDWAGRNSDQFLGVIMDSNKRAFAKHAAEEAVEQAAE